MAANVALPQVLYTGQAYRLDIEGEEPGFEYRITYSSGNGVWLSTSFSTSGSLTIDTSGAGLLYVGLQSRAIGSQALSSNTYVGEIHTYDAVKSTGLLDNAYAGRLQVKVIDSGVSMEASGTAWRDGITSWRDLASFIEQKFQTAAATMPFAGDEARAFYYMQWVSGFWMYGNLTSPLLPGCVTNNEVNGVVAPENVTVRTFLESPIGCCTDYSTVLSFLLLGAGIETRVISGEGHVFLEAKLNGVWWTIDANLNQAIRASFDQVLNTTQQVEVLRFDHAGMTEGSAVFREGLVDFYHTFMQFVEIGRFDYGYRRDALTFFDSLPYGNTFRDSLDTTGWTGGLGPDIAQPIYAAAGWTLGDFNGDGKTDLLTTLSGGLGASVVLSSGASFGSATTWSSTVNPGTGLLLTGDFDGNGTTDLLADRGGASSAMVYLSTGVAFATEAAWSIEASGDFGWWSGDFNGDGKSDIFRMINGVAGADVFLSTGTSFAYSGNWTTAGSGSTAWVIGDFDGDGDDDIAGYDQLVGTYVHLSNGSLFGDTAIWTTASIGAGDNWFVGDYNADGKDDLGRRTGLGAFEVLYSTGAGFGAPQAITTRPLTSNFEFRVGDFDGDGTSDVFYAHRTFNGGALQPFSNVADHNGLTPAEVNRVVSFTPARIIKSEVDSPVSALSAVIDVSAVFNLKSLYDLSVAGFAALPAYGLPVSAAIGKVLYYSQWVGNLSLAPAAISTAAVSDDQRNKAALLAAFLSHEGVTNNVITTQRFTVNEVFVDGGWWSVNAALGIAFEGRWHDVIDTAHAPRMFVFDTAAMTHGAQSHSAFVGAAHEDFLVKVGSGVAFDFNRSEGADWLANEPYGASFASFVSLPLAAMRAAGFGAPSGGGNAWFKGDFDGDGRGDLMASFGTAGATISLSAGSSFNPGSVWTTSSSGSQGWYVGDFNGDGKTDIFSVVKGLTGAKMLLSTGTGFVDGGNWTPAGSGAQRWYVADFNGDGKDDVLRYVTGVSGAQVFLSTGTSFVGWTSWTPAGQGSVAKWFIGDFDGDGKDDLGRVVNAQGFQVMKSTGAAFSGPVTWAAGITSADRLDVFDANGDGLTDLYVQATTSAASRLYLSTGTQLRLATDWTGLPASSAQTLFLDINGDGTTDFARVASYSFPMEIYTTSTVRTAETTIAEVAVAETFTKSLGFGNDVVVAFTPSGTAADIVQLSPDLATSYAAVQGVMQQVGVDVVITFNANDSLTLRGLDLSTLSSSNFLFV